MPLIDWRPDQYSDFGPATLSNGGPSSQWLTVGGDGHIYEGGARLVVTADHYIETNCGFASDADLNGVVKHSAAYGINFVRFLGWNNKAVATTGLYNLGCWTDPSGTGANNGAVVYGATYNEAFLVRMDKTIAALNARGIRLWLNFDHGDKARIVAGLAPNTANGSTSTKAANGDHGMMWSAEWNAMYQAHIATILNRVNTQTGVAYRDNPMISVVAPFNENSLWDAATKPISDATYPGNTGLDYIVLEVGGTGSGPSGGSGYWRTALDAHWNAYAAAKGFAWPVSRFPLYAAWWAWGNTDKERMISYICDTDLAAALDYRSFIKALMPSVLYCYVETRYADIRVSAAANDVMSLHAYSSEGSGSRKSSVDNSNSGINYSFYSQRLVGQPHVVTEDGQQTIAGRSRNDFDSHPFRATCTGLQDADGQIFFCMWQSQYYSVVAGSLGGHYMAMYPSRRLGALFAAPIIKHRLIGPLTGAPRALQVDPAGVPARIRSTGEVCQMGERAYGSSAVFWTWLKERIYTSLGTPESLTPDTSISTAAVQAGVTVPSANGTFTVRGAGAANPRMTWDYPAVMGHAIHVDNFTSGRLTISGLAAPYRGIAAIRSSGPWAIGAGPSVLFLHGPTFNTDATVSGDGTYPNNLNAFLAGDELTITGGTEAQTRLWTPPAVTVTLADIGRKQRVYGLTAGALTDVTGTLVPSSWNAATGTLTFASNPQYPAYHIEPDDQVNGRVVRQWSRQRGGVRGDSGTLSEAPSGGEQGLDFSSPDNSGYLSLHSIGV